MSIDAPIVHAWKPAVPGIREVLHARFGEHAYPPHTHDAWTLFVVDDGAVRYDLDRRERSAVPSAVSILPPWVTHDGRPATPDGYRKRVVYVEPDVLGESRIGPAVDAPAIADPALWRAVDALHAALASPDDALEAETRFAFVAERLRAAVPGDRGGESPVESVARDEVAEALRAWLDARLTESVTLRAAAAELGAGETTLARAFARDFGIAPHRYVIGRRLDLARDRILDGEPLATVAADLGFTDQAHLTRSFKRFLGTTPGRFGRSV